jgi:hypothetical protein
MRVIFRIGPVLVAIVFFAAGCGSAGPIPVKISGKVLLDGQPMSDGDIYFEAGDGRVPVQTKISDGRYSLPPLPGEYRVLTHQYRDSGTKNMYGKPQMESTIPSRYNVDTELKATVTKDGPHEFNFEILSE